MKVTISFTHDEKEKSQTIANLVKAVIPCARIHSTVPKNGYFHIYIFDKKKTDIDSTADS